MKLYVLVLALAHALTCSGVPVYNAELESMAVKGLKAALTEVNSVHAVNNLYRVTRGSVSKVIPLGQGTADLLISFGIRETTCAKASGSEPQTCPFRPGFFVPTLNCVSRVRSFPASIQVLSLRCGADSDSSEESSEEMSPRGRHHFNIPFAARGPAPTAPAQPAPPRPGQGMDVGPRRDPYSNFLE